MKLHCERGVRNQARACGLLQLCPRAALNLLRFDTCARSCLPSTLCASPDSGLPCHEAGQPHLSDECGQMQALASVSGILQRSQPRTTCNPGATHARAGGRQARASKGRPTQQGAQTHPDDHAEREARALHRPRARPLQQHADRVAQVAHGRARRAGDVGQLQRRRALRRQQPHLRRASTVLTFEDQGRVFLTLPQDLSTARR